MNWNRLNTLVPKRWILLLRYYLPFFKKPEPIYFKLRQFVDKKIKANKEWRIQYNPFLRILKDYQ